MRVFKKPISESEYLNGIIRNSKINVTGTGNNNNYLAIVGNDYSSYWHTIQDSSFSQYVQIDFVNSYIIPTSYMFHTGNNDATYSGKRYIFYSKNWNINCSYDMKTWHAIDVRKNEPRATSVMQKLLFDMQSSSVCRSIRVHITGVDSQNRCYGYIGPFELYGKITNNLFVTCKIKGRMYLSLLLFILLVKHSSEL